MITYEIENNIYDSVSKRSIVEVPTFRNVVDLEKLYPKLQFIEADILHDEMLNDISTLPRIELIMNKVSNYYLEKLPLNLNNIYSHSSSFFRKEFIDSTIGFKIYQKYFYLLCYIHFLKENIDTPEFRDIPSIDIIREWIIPRSSQGIEFLINGPKHNLILNTNYRKHYPQLISPANDMTEILNFQQLSSIQSTDTNLQKFHTSFINNPNVYRKFPDILRAYNINIDSSNNVSGYIDDKNNLIFDFSKVLLKDPMFDDNSRKYSDLTSDITSNVVIPRSNLAKLRKLFDNYGRIKINALTINRETFVTSLDNFERVYVVFGGISASERNVYNTGGTTELKIAGRFTLKNDVYEFQQELEALTYKEKLVEIKGFNVYITTHRGHGRNIILPNPYNLEIEKTDIYHYPVFVGNFVGPSAVVPVDLLSDGVGGIIGVTSSLGFTGGYSPNRFGVKNDFTPLVKPTKEESLEMINRGNQYNKEYLERLIAGTITDEDSQMDDTNENNDDDTSENIVDGYSLMNSNDSKVCLIPFYKYNGSEFIREPNDFLYTDIHSRVQQLPPNIAPPYSMDTNYNDKYYFNYYNLKPKFTRTEAFWSANITVEKVLKQPQPTSKQLVWISQTLDFSVNDFIMLNGVHISVGHRQVQVHGMAYLVENIVHIIGTYVYQNNCYVLNISQEYESPFNFFKTVTIYGTYQSIPATRGTNIRGYIGNVYTVDNGELLLNGELITKKNYEFEQQYGDKTILTKIRYNKNLYSVLSTDKDERDLLLMVFDLTRDSVFVFNRDNTLLNFLYIAGKQKIGTKFRECTGEIMFQVQEYRELSKESNCYKSYGVRDNLITRYWNPDIFKMSILFLCTNFHEYQPFPATNSDGEANILIYRNEVYKYTKDEGIITLHNGILKIESDKLELNNKPINNIRVLEYRKIHYTINRGFSNDIDIDINSEGNVYMEITDSESSNVDKLYIMKIYAKDKGGICTVSKIELIQYDEPGVVICSYNDFIPSNVVFYMGEFECVLSYQQTLNNITIVNLDLIKTLHYTTEYKSINGQVHFRKIDTMKYSNVPGDVVVTDLVNVLSLSFAREKLSYSINDYICKQIISPMYVSNKNNYKMIIKTNSPNHLHPYKVNSGDGTINDYFIESLDSNISIVGNSEFVGSIVDDSIKQKVTFIPTFSKLNISLEFT